MTAGFRNMAAIRGVGICLLLGLLSSWPRPVESAPPQGEGAVPTEQLQHWTAGQLESLVQLYKELHQSPELSFEEKQTAARLATELRKLGAEVTTDLGGHGVVALLKNGAGPTIMYRADMDALPVKEQTNLVYASRQTTRNEAGDEVSVMHACGHDVHMTCLIGVARYLATHPEQWSGTAMFVCQPAEERGAGAKAMLEAGLFERFPKPDAALALHVDSSLETGKIGYRGGYSMANVDSVDIQILGRGGHGAYPHTTLDPIVIAAGLVLDLQTIVSREISPTDPAVITVGSIHGGTKHNVIGDHCDLQLTVRSYTDEVRNHLLEAIARKAKAAAAGAGSPEPIIKVHEGTPALANDEDLVVRVLPALARVVGEENLELAEPVMGGEDFGRYGRAGVPIFMYRLGSVLPLRLSGMKRVGAEPPSLHSALYYPDAPETIQTGVAASLAAMLELLGPAANTASDAGNGPAGEN